MAALAGCACQVNANLKVVFVSYADYPARLATFSLPSSAWPTAIFNNKLFCVPQVDTNTGPDLLGNGKQLSQVGTSFDFFKTTDDFTRIAKQLTDPGNHWAIGSNILTWMMQVSDSSGVRSRAQRESMRTRDQGGSIQWTIR